MDETQTQLSANSLEIINPKNYNMSESQSCVESESIISLFILCSFPEITYFVTELSATSRLRYPPGVSQSFYY